MPLLPVGNYRVRIEKEGFAPYVRQQVVLQANTNVQIDAHLEVKSAAEQITISAESSLVQATASNLVQVVDEKQVADLPLDGRNVLQLIGLNAGVADRGAAGFTRQANSYGRGRFHYASSVNGSRGDGSNFLLDNADNNEG